MTPLRLLLALLLLGTTAGAQRVYFVYLQTDDRAPFFVKLADKVHASSATGYVILPNLVDSTYVLGIGFPGNNSVNRFEVKVDKADRGFVLKNVGGGWNLFDLQSLTLQKALAANGPSDADNRNLLAAADPFTRLLVQASDDPTLLHAGPFGPPAEPGAMMASLPVSTTASAQAAVLRDTVPVRPVSASARVVSDTTLEIGGDDTTPPAAAATMPPSVAAPAASAPAEPVYQRSLVKRRSESSTTEGFGLVFHDVQDGQVDTIRILIPNPKEVALPAASVQATAPVPPDSSRRPANDSVQVANTGVGNAVAAPGTNKGNCKAEAGEKDLLKLRRSMVAASDEGSMITAARKGFRNMCYTTEQVRHLGGLFFTDLGKYNLYQAAWGHVSDPANFEALGKELRDAYLVKRLNELTRQ
ncbi:hypothetical protein [Flaviaesturariibacter amylovorans]